MVGHPGTAPSVSSSQLLLFLLSYAGIKQRYACRITGRIQCDRRFPPEGNWWRWRESHPLAQSCKDWPSL